MTDGPRQCIVMPRTGSLLIVMTQAAGTVTRTIRVLAAARRARHGHPAPGSRSSPRDRAALSRTRRSRVIPGRGKATGIIRRVEFTVGGHV